MNICQAQKVFSLYFVMLNKTMINKCIRCYQGFKGSSHDGGFYKWRLDVSSRSQFHGQYVDLTIISLEKGDLLDEQRIPNWVSKMQENYSPYFSPFHGHYSTIAPPANACFQRLPSDL